MMRLSKIYSPLFILLLVSAACSVPGVATPDAGSISTAAAQTVIAGLTQGAPVELPSPTLEFTPTPEFTFTPSLTPTETQTPTPLFTATSTVPMISVSVNTNCRVGPGRVYGRVGALLVGQSAEVHGRDPGGNYWYIRNPGAGAQFCWVWGEYATLTGPYMFLPVFTPPPTPTATMTPTPTATPTPVPAFRVRFEGRDSCIGWWVDLELKNTGSVAFRSMTIEVVDTVTKVRHVSFVNEFVDLDGCMKSTKKDRLLPGDTFTVSAPEFTYDPIGHRIRTTVTLCSQIGQKGSCVTKRIVFEP